MYSRKFTKCLQGTGPLFWYSNDFWNQSFWPIQCILAISKNIPIQLKTGFVLHG